MMYCAPVAALLDHAQKSFQERNIIDDSYNNKYIITVKKNQQQVR